MEYRYHLLKYKGSTSRLTCPNCGKHNCFTPYVDADGKMVGELYGRCNHESSCGYVKYPPSNFSPFKTSKCIDNKKRKRPQPTAALKEIFKLCTIPMEIVFKTVRTNPASDFLTFLLSIFDRRIVNEVAKDYLLGVTKARDVIFYQIDGDGRCRTGKVMKYDPLSGHRIKVDVPGNGTPITWVHSLLKQQGVLPQDWELTQCLFGEHLLKKYPDKPVALVESEKTAVICACINPDCVWLATGGKGQLNDRVEVLSGRRVIAFPDVDGYDAWVTKAAERPHLGIIVSDLLEKNATPEEREAHIDIADLLIKWKQAEARDLRHDSVGSPASLAHTENATFQKVKQYISPDYHLGVMALIDELGLELKDVCKLDISTIVKND